MRAAELYLLAPPDLDAPYREQARAGLGGSRANARQPLLRSLVITAVARSRSFDLRLIRLIMLAEISDLSQMKHINRAGHTAHKAILHIKHGDYAFNLVHH